MSDEEKQCYELVKHNSRNPDPATTTIVGTVRGLDRAQRAVEVLDDRLKPDEREAGFSHYFQEGKKPVDRKDRFGSAEAVSRMPPEVCQPKRHVLELFEYVRGIGVGEILCLEVRHGLPFSMEIRDLNKELSLNQPF